MGKKRGEGVKVVKMGGEEKESMRGTQGKGARDGPTVTLAQELQSTTTVHAW